MAPRYGAVARALLCAVCFLFVFVFNALATLSYGRETLLKIREEGCGLSFVNTGLRCADFDVCPTRGKRGQESGRGGREQRERTGRRYRYTCRTFEPLSEDITCYQRKKRRHRGKRGGLLVRLRSGRSRIPLPAIYLANVQSLPNKVDDLLSRIKAQREARDCSVFCLTETWLHSGVPDSSLQPPGFSVHRLDRVKERTGKSKGGVSGDDKLTEKIRREVRRWEAIIMDGMLNIQNPEASYVN
ncbi:uncharacterized protein LOC125257189 isoform X3 [Megalobrama amblycephala]|uniref:uncharacterized protein LOC125257189 isoform X3 n=1 Tax=Megalobrama amblycephala TaxID=75352 RepID=UPI0020143B85|nr:uncharacterized protein LOC125257189 isoform X3 [Megalobrama amblycephala]